VVTRELKGRMAGWRSGYVDDWRRAGCQPLHEKRNQAGCGTDRRRARPHCVHQR
jgi:hypothetical protein